MAKRPILEDQLAALHAQLDADLYGESARAALQAALDAKQSVLVAAAASAIARGELAGFAPQLCAAFERFIDNAVKRDPGCRAKTAVAHALYRTEAAATPVFLRGIRLVQLEPVWGGTQDTAIELRGTCGLGLVRSGYPDALVELAELLADPEPMARAAAAQAIAYSERSDIGVPLLRLKALAGDADQRVTSACFSALLALAPERSLPFVAAFVQRSEPELREAAALALGESRLPQALVVLQELAARAVTADDCSVALLAVALVRSDAAWEYLIGLVREGGASQARAAVDAMATYRDDAGLSARVLAAAEERGDPRLLAHARTALKRAT